MPMPTQQSLVSPRRMSVAGSVTGRSFWSTALTSVKIAELAPMPRASVSSTVMVNPGVRRSWRKAKLISRPNVSSVDIPRDSRHSSFTWLRPPNSSRVVRIASSRVRPARICFSTCWSKWKCNSSSNSPSTALGRKRARKRIDRSLNKPLSILSLLHRSKHLGHCSSKLRPGFLLHFQLSPPFFGELVVLRAAVVFRCSPIRFDQAATLKAMQGRVEGALLDSQRLARQLLHALGDRPSVLWPEGQGSKDK